MMNSRAHRLITFSAIALVFILGGASAAPQPTHDSIVEGTLTYRERVALPPEAVAEVSLLDTSLADAPATVIARANVRTGGRQVPLPFALRYAPDRIEPNHTYTVRAVIRNSGQTLFTTDAAYPVITQGHPSRIELTLVSVAGSASGSALQGTRWLLEDLKGRGVLDRIQATLEFTDESRVVGNASCNRFFGTAEVGEGSISFGPLGTTRMSCPKAVMRQETRYLQALKEARTFEFDGSYLLIFGHGSAQPLRFTRLNTATVPQPKHDSLAYRAAGTEPFWNLVINREGFRFATPDAAEGVLFTPDRLEMAEGTLHGVGTARNSIIKVLLRPGSCSDGMSERNWPYHAEVQTGETMYQGCAAAVR